MEQRLVRVSEAARMMAIGRTQVWRLCASGALASIKISKTRRIPVTAIDDYIGRKLQEQSQSGGQGPAAARRG